MTAATVREATSAEVFGGSLGASAAPAVGGRIVVFEFTGTGFLRHMVRNAVGTLVEIGLGRREPAWMAEVLASGDRAQAGPTAPARGLFLVGVSDRVSSPARLASLVSPEPEPGCAPESVLAPPERSL